jgi:hypothetical protein
MIVQYQVGVDVLGFPIYVEHHIIIGESKENNKIKPDNYNNKLKPYTKKWISILQKIVKQH